MHSSQVVVDRQRRLAELDRIAKIQAECNSDLTEEEADALIQRYLAEDRKDGSTAMLRSDH